MSEYRGFPPHERSFRVVTGEQDLNAPGLEEQSPSRLQHPSGDTARSCGVVVPCFNEAGRLDVAKFSDFANRSSDVELIFVDDGSTDETVARACEVHQQAVSSVNVLSLASNQGKGEAVRRGMRWAAQRGYSTIGFWDADLATPLEAIHGFQDVFRKYSHVDVVWGTRLCLLGHSIERDFIRRQIGRIFSSASAAAVGVGIRDALCGAKMFRNGKMLTTVLSMPYRSRWIFDVEMLARLRILASQNTSRPLHELMYEYPLDQWFEMAGSKLRTVDFMRAASELTGLCWRYRFLSAKAKHHLIAQQSPRDQHETGAFVCECEVICEVERPQQRLRRVA